VSRLLKVVDVFAGCGGLTSGFLGTRRFKVVAAVEKDPQAAATYALNHGEDHTFCGDIKDWLAEGVPAADVVVGGPPCQGFSALGSQYNRDARNALWRRYVDVLVQTKPLYFVLENVATFLGSGQFRDLRRETHRSGRLSGYRIEAGVLNAAEFGVPQLRRRAIVIGSMRDLPAPGLPIGAFAGSPKHFKTVRQSIGDLPYDISDIDLPESTVEVNDDVFPGPFKTLDLHLTRRVTPLSMERYRAIPAGGSRRDLPDRLLAPCWRGHTTGSFDVMGRLRWDSPSVTIRTEFNKPEKGRYLHPIANRPLTHLEAARLQGFPDDYLWAGSKTSIARQIGNAVPRPLAEALAHHLRALVR
jgi:DNA (cytosine-5)-methyltransferase 1